MSQQVEAIHPDEDSSLVIQKFKVKKATLIMIMRMMMGIMIKNTLLVVMMTVMMMATMTKI